MNAMTLPQKAYSFAQDKHKGQFRKDGSPYFTHPIRVAVSVSHNLPDDYPNKEEIVCAAYLHDTLEDTNTSQKELVEEFGELVFSLVLGVTSDKDLVRKMGKTVYLTDKMIQMTDDELFIKLCDRFDNVSDLHNASDDKWAEKYRQETFDILYQLQKARNFTDVQKKMVQKIYWVLYS